MSNREDELAGRIAQRLGQGLAEMDQNALARLRAARETAVERIQYQPTWALAPAGGPSLLSGPLRYFNPRYLVPVVALLLAITGMVYWQQMHNIDELADIDAKLLSGDLPIDAYLDKGIDSWLTR
jgi:hypothetical protein